MRSTLVKHSVEVTGRVQGNKHWVRSVAIILGGIKNSLRPAAARGSQLVYDAIVALAPTVRHTVNVARLVENEIASRFPAVVASGEPIKHGLVPWSQDRGRDGRWSC